ncbi:PD-(D/E)XK nuclease family protein [Candidatus Minimicrobia naudis]|uniref:PD-(D/E)XK nuclease family protein n=1 Tax=Candidatus Minimicrobia naudis TaxID=2841263 RepID=A0A8F1SBU6_9BACT|nr:PD-(D/E)XK nuclease family protein [Candidatus Minimicrobia naudis]
MAPALETYKLSATHLNNFLDVSRGGPQNFLLNNLLHFPSAKNSAAAYGTAIHSSLQQAHCSFSADHQLPSTEQILQFFQKNPSRASICQRMIFNCIWTKGSRLWIVFLNANSSDFHDTDLAELDFFSNQGVIIDNARLTGKLDVVDIDKQNKTIFVTDYKTGKPAHSWKEFG